MRVIAGDLKGQRLVAPKGWKVRPTSDRVREAIFSTLGDRVQGAAVLDLYCGTGALAIEALSRGAGRAVLIDRDTRPALGKVSAATFAGKFDLVFVDAPYKLADRVAEDLNIHLPKLLSSGGRAVVESGARRPLRIDSLEPLRQRRYGAADVSIYAGTNG